MLDKIIHDRVRCMVVVLNWPYPQWWSLSSLTLQIHYVRPTDLPRKPGSTQSRTQMFTVIAIEDGTRPPRHCREFFRFARSAGLVETDPVPLLSGRFVYQNVLFVCYVVFLKVRAWLAHRPVSPPALGDLSFSVLCWSHSPLYVHSTYSFMALWCTHGASDRNYESIDVQSFKLVCTLWQPQRSRIRSARFHGCGRCHFYRRSFRSTPSTST